MPALSPAADSRFRLEKDVKETLSLFLAMTAPFCVPVSALRSYLPVLSSLTPLKYPNTILNNGEGHSF